MASVFQQNIAALQNIAEMFYFSIKIYFKKGFPYFNHLNIKNTNIKAYFVH